MNDDARANLPAPERRRWSSGRSPHRQAAHEEAHAGEHQARSVLNHELVPSNEPTLITDQASLEILVGELRACGAFAYDTEFIGEQTYWPRLCLIQTATPSRVGLVDALAPLDLRPFWTLVADETIEKTVHAGEQDLEPVLRNIGQTAANIFDVQIAAAFLGLPYPSSLGKLVLSLTNIDVGHSTKFSQWDHRPLTPRQLHYAANDVRFLPLLRQAMARQLDQAGVTAWAAEECATLTDPARYTVDHASQRMKVRGATDLTPRQRAMLRELSIWRESTARAADLPVRAIVPDEAMLALVRTPVKNRAALDRIKGLPRATEEHYGNEIVEATRRGMAAPVDDFIGRPPRDIDAHRARIEQLWKTVECAAASRQIDPRIVTSKKELGALAYAAEQIGRREHEMVSRLNQGWRRALLGECWSE